jgi:hypothetical protein
MIGIVSISSLLDISDWLLNRADDRVMSDLKRVFSYGKLYVG